MSEFSEMSEFDETLARAVQEGIARGGLPGAADAVRRGRRRGLRARGGVAVLGMAAIAGTMGIGTTFGGGGSGAVGAGSGGHGPSAYGIMPASQWPGYAIADWKLSAGCGWADRSKCNAGDPTVDHITSLKIGDVFGVCTPGPTYPVRQSARYDTQHDDAHQLDGEETVYTLPDRAAAAAFLADARAAGAPKKCPPGPPQDTSTSTEAPGVSTTDGLSWVTSGKGTPDARPFYTHSYLVQVDDRIAVLGIQQDGTGAMQSTEYDAQVLADMARALEK